MSTIAKIGEGKFKLDFRLFGQRFRKVFSSYEEANQFKHHLESRYRLTTSTIQAASDKYLEHISSRKKAKSEDVDRNVLSAFIALVGGDKYVHEVKPQQIEEYRSNELKRGVKPSTVNRKLNSLKHFFRTCEVWEFIEYSPTRNIRALGSTTTQRKTWDAHQVDTITAKLSKRDQAIFKILAITGARLSSALSLTWGDLEFTNRKIWFTTRKGPKSIERKYYFPLTDALLQIFQQVYQQSNPSDYVFLSKNSKKVNAEHYSRKISKLLKKHFPDHNLTLHGLRHSFATNLSRKGVPIKDIMSLLGHSSVKVTEGYIGTREEDLFKIVS